MWVFMKTALLGWLLKQTFGRLILVLMGALLPIAALLKGVGLPLLIVVLVLGAPLFVLLALVGLPLLLVAITVGLLMAAVAAALKIGLMLLAVVLPVVGVVLIARWLLNGEHGDDAPPVEPAPDHGG
jgi:hypothetical protein